MRGAVQCREDRNGVVKGDYAVASRPLNPRHVPAIGAKGIGKIRGCVSKAEDEHVFGHNFFGMIAQLPINANLA